MFTGIVEELGRVRSVEPNATGARLGFEARLVLEDADVGGSIAVNGCCLTVVERGATWWAADAVEETLRRTSLGALRAGDPVNPERPVRATDRLGGHLVQGHVDGQGRIAGRADNPDGSLLVWIRTPPRLLRYVVEKGSIAVDGVSLTVVGVDELVAYRRQRESPVRRLAVSRLPTPVGDFAAYAFESTRDGLEHLAVVRGDLAGPTPVLVRVHSECLSGDVFGSRRCDCGEQLRASLQVISDAGRGVLVYLRGHEGRGIGLGPTLRAYALQDEGLDTVEANLRLGLPADARAYDAAAAILRCLGVSRLRLLTNNPSKRAALVAHGLDVVERVPLLTTPTRDNARYLRAKQDRLGHLLRLG